MTEGGRRSGTISFGTGLNRLRWGMSSTLLLCFGGETMNFVGNSAVLSIQASSFNSVFSGDDVGSAKQVWKKF